MAIVHRIEATSPQEAVDTWIEVGLDSPELREYVLHGPSVTGVGKTVWRAEFGSKAAEAKKWLKGHIVSLDWKSTSESRDALQKGVIAPNGGAYWILQLRLPSGGRYGRSIQHSEKDHPENVQDEFLLGPGIKFKVMVVKSNETVLVAQNSMRR